MILQNTRKPRIRGRKIVKIDWNEFNTGRQDSHGKLAKSTDPKFYLDDGSILTFSVEETEIGEYGISVNWHRPEKS